MPFDGTLPESTTEDVVAAVSDPDDQGWLAYLWIGPDDPRRRGHRAAQLAQSGLSKLKIYRVADRDTVAAWLDSGPVPADEAHGIIVGIHADPIVTIDKRTADSSRRLSRAITDVR